MNGGGAVREVSGQQDPMPHGTARLPRGFRCASRHIGLKREGKDLALFASDVDAAAAAVFTLNRFPGAPVVRGREILRAGVLRAIAVNSKISNVATGAAGLEAADRMARAAGAELGVDADRVLVASTGVIGVPLPIDRIEAGLRGMSAELGEDPVVGAAGMMTTDTHPKAMSIDAGPATLTIVAKGSGMIAPNMATMLAYLFTDAELSAGELDGLLRAAVRDSFNMLSIDTDTSTSDMCVILANGRAGLVDVGEFGRALHTLCIGMAQVMARDGEGATKLLRVTVHGASADDDARRVARTVVDSPLIKTMAHGSDPNVGRILMAIGKCIDVDFEPDGVHARVAGIDVVRSGLCVDFDAPSVRAALGGDPVDIEIEIGDGIGTATAFGCDLTEGYITENAAYTSS